MTPIDVRSVVARGAVANFQKLWERAGRKIMAKKSHERGETRKDAEGN